MPDHKQPPPQPHSPSSNPPLRGTEKVSQNSSSITGPIHDNTQGQESKNQDIEHSRDQGGQEATQRIEDKKQRQEGKREEVKKEEEGKRQAVARTNNKPAPAAGGMGGPMGTAEGRKEDRLKGKL